MGGKFAKGLAKFLGFGAAFMVPGYLLGKATKGNEQMELFKDRYKEDIMRTPGGGGVIPYYQGNYAIPKFANIINIANKRDTEVKMDKIAKTLGLTKIAKSDEELGVKLAAGLAKAGASVDGLLRVTAELDPIIKAAMISEEYGLPYEDVVIMAADISTDGKIEKTAEEKGVDMVKLAESVLEKTEGMGKVASIMAKVFSIYGEADHVDSLNKLASSRYVTKGEVNIAAAGLELAEEGYSPELLDKYAEAMEMPLEKVASDIIGGELSAMKLIESGKLSAKAIEKVATSEKFSEPTKIGFLNSIEKLAHKVRPNGLSKIAGVKQPTPKKDSKVHELIMKAANYLGYDDFAVQDVYAYAFPKYAADKLDMEIDDRFAKEAKQSVKFLAKLGAALEKNDLYGDTPEETIIKTAEALNEDPNDLMVDLFKTAALIEEDNPMDIDFEAIEKYAGAIVAAALDRLRFEKE